MSQGNLVLPTTGTVSGLTMAQDINAALDALATQSSGASAPNNAAGAAAELGQLWLNTTSATAPTLEQYTGSAWVVIATLDVTQGIWTPPIGGGTATTITSAATTDLGTKPNSYLTISDTNTITGLGSSAVNNEISLVTFSGILTLTHNGTSLILPTASNITTAAGDSAGFVYLGGGNWRCLFYQTASGAPLSTAAVGAAQLISSSQGMNSALNLRLNATVSGGALTVSIVGANNSAPSSSNPVRIPFRDATIAYGDPVIASLQSALSFSTPTSGNTIGAQSGGIAFRLWVCAYYNGGTLAVGLFNASIATQIFGLPEGDLVTTAASTNGGSSAGTHYANVSTITNTPYRILGYLEWGSGLTTAGTWASAPTKIVLFGPGIKKPGDAVQSIYSGSGGSQAITPASAANLIKYSMTYIASAFQSTAVATFKRASTTLQTSTIGIAVSGVTGYCSMTAVGLDAPSTASSVSYTTTSSTGTPILQTILLEEIMG